MIRREPMSSTDARCSLPSSVGISVPSPYHSRFSALAGKSRPIRSGARHLPVPDRVLCLRRFFALAIRRCSRMILATVFSLTRQPASRRSSVIRGEPYLPWRAANSCRIAIVSCSRPARRGEASP
jgi:hypothetical protein